MLFIGPRWGHALELLPDSRSPSSESVFPVVFGGTVVQTEIYDPETQEWSAYKDMPGVRLTDHTTRYYKRVLANHYTMVRKIGSTVSA